MHQTLRLHEDYLRRPTQIFSEIPVLENFPIVSTNDLTSENSNKNTMSPVLGTNGGRSKINTVFMHFCIECNGKSLKFDTIAKIVMYIYIYMIREKKIKSGGYRSYKKTGAVPKVRIGDKTPFLSRSRTLKQILCKI